MKKLILLSSLLYLPLPLLAGENSRVRFGIGLDLLASPEYHSFLNDAYDDVVGGFGWLGLRAGLACKVNDRLSIQPQISGYFNSVKVTSFGWFESEAINHMFIPALVVRFFPYQGKKLGWSLSGEINKPKASSDLTGVNFNGKGIGTGFASALRFNKRLSVELGYKIYPVQVATNIQNGGPVNTINKTYNLGGVSLGIYREF